MLFNRKSALHSTKVEMPTNKTKLNCILGVVGGASGAHDALLKRRFLNECASRRKQREFLFGKSCFLPMNFGPKNNNCCRRQFMPAWWGKSGFLLIKCLSMIYIDCICMTVTRNSFGQKKKNLRQNLQLSNKRSKNFQLLHRLFSTSKNKLSPKFEVPIPSPLVFQRFLDGEIGKAKYWTYWLCM